MAEYVGLHVFDASSAIIEHLKSRTRHDADISSSELGATTEGTVLLRRETYEHSYPHCWRCRNPLIYMAVSSWFVSTTAIRDRMLELNEEVTWVPEHVKHGQFGKWLENTRDWSISRNRYWYGSRQFGPYLVKRSSLPRCGRQAGARERTPACPIAQLGSSQGARFRNRVPWRPGGGRAGQCPQPPPDRLPAGHAAIGGCRTGERQSPYGSPTIPLIRAWMSTARLPSLRKISVCG